MYKILIVEDDSVINKAITEKLDSWGYITQSVDDFNGVVSKVKDFAPQLILLDIMLPFYNGFYWCGEIRKFSSTPIIFLSSASDNMNIVMAMNMGGDDFISKPFDFNVLIAKMTAILRRTYDYNNESNCIEHGGVFLNLSTSILENNGQKTELTKTETKIMELLLIKGESIVSKEDIMQKLWQNEEFIDDNVLAVNIARLRKKLTNIGLEDYLICRKGLGYIIN